MTMSEETIPDRGAWHSDGRDRDHTGRARNARPRDASGRPLPRGEAGVDRVPEDLVLPPGQALAEAQRLIDESLPFQAHEILEGAWKAAEETERPLWQGLAQLAVGLTHTQRGNATGAVSLLRRGTERIEPFGADAPHGIDVPGLLAHGTALAARIERDGLDNVTAADLHPRLRR